MVSRREIGTPICKGYINFCGVNDVSNVSKVLVGAFNQEKALVVAFSVIVKTECETDGALHSTTHNITAPTSAGYQNGSAATLSPGPTPQSCHRVKRAE